MNADGKILGLQLGWTQKQRNEHHDASQSTVNSDDPDSDLFRALKKLLNPRDDTSKKNSLVWLFNTIGIETIDDLCVVEESMLVDSGKDNAGYFGAFAQPTFRKKLLHVVDFLVEGHELTEGLSIQEIMAMKAGMSRNSRKPRPFSAPDASIQQQRRLTQNDTAILKNTEWSSTTIPSSSMDLNPTSYTDFLQLEDKVSLADPRYVFLQGVVVFVGTVHFADGVHVGVQLTGPSIGCGTCDGTFQGSTYFANVGKRNGVLVPVAAITARRDTDLSTPEQSEEQMRRAKAMVDVLTNQRAAAILNETEEQRSHRRTFFPMFGNGKEELYIQRLRETYLGKAIRNRPASRYNDQPPQYSSPGSTLRPADYALAAGLNRSHQTFCLSDPTLPGNPIVYASASFLHLTGYHLNDVLGRNCRFLQGPLTDQAQINIVRESIVEGVDCHVCLLNYRRDGTTFHNRLFMTALRDCKGRIKSFLGVQCEVSEEVAKRINAEEISIFDAGLRRTGTRFTAVASSTATLDTPRKGGQAENSESLCYSDSNHGYQSMQPKRNSGSTQTTEGANYQNSFSSVRSPLVPADYDLEEAMFRSTMENPLAPMSYEEQRLFEDIKSGLTAGYSADSQDISVKVEDDHYPVAQKSCTKPGPGDEDIRVEI